MNISLVNEQVKSLIGNRGRSFRISHFQLPTTPSSVGTNLCTKFGDHRTSGSFLFPPAHPPAHPPDYDPFAMTIPFLKLRFAERQKRWVSL